ncbi:ShlB/FhaC/HecB family hemolysin secretion/activation protein [Chroococcus sp. FPU101]|uniref:ShlB/FhaC/HecB family hemolysin secretion/activation protein n=1 Tax=Chroococcus sp. FPU101 TaxID=1974212 RepID=UPI001A8C3EAB|nr:ShlB/FhaC/HecB family hemolysin secretion/activation protein [Chroococcus sp. FPU101]
MLLKNNTVFTQEEINAIAAPYLNQPINPELFLELQDKLTQAYVDRGYFTSFVVIEGQPSGGTLIFNAIEGIAIVNVNGSGIRDDYIKSKLEPFLDQPLQKERLGEGLSLLLIDPLVKNLQNTITPGDRLSESIINVNFVPQPKWNIGAEISNDENFTVGSWGIRGFIENNNIAGGGEQFRAEYKVTEGLDRFVVGATIPILPTRSRIELTYQQSNSNIIDGFFKDFDIKNDSYVASFRFTQAIWQKFNESLDFSFGVDHRESQNFVLNDKLFSNVRLTAIRLDQTYIKRSAKSLAIVLSQFSIGLSNQEVDSTFFHWQGQGQYLYNFGIGQVFTRLALQLTPQSLPNIEQCAIGGRNGNQFIFGNTVRGYTTNARTGDSCIAGTLEVRFPFYKTNDVEFSGFPFLDIGYVWNTRGGSADPQTLVGTGVGVRLSYRDLLLIQTNYGFALNDTNSGFDDLTQGLSFSVLGQFRF